MNKKISNKTDIKQRLEELEKQSQILKSELEIELGHTKEKVVDLGKIALGIGGGLLLAFLILGKFSDGKSKSNRGEHSRKKRVYQRFRNQLARELTSQATGFLLGIAKDKLSSMVDHNEKEEHADS